MPAAPRTAAASAFLGRAAAMRVHSRVALVDALPEGAVVYPSGPSEAPGARAARGVPAAPGALPYWPRRPPPPRAAVLYPPEEDGPLEVGSVQEERELLAAQNANPEERERAALKAAAEAGLL